MNVATTVQSHGKGHQKVNIHKIGVTAVMNCLLSLKLTHAASNTAFDFVFIAF